MTATSTSPTVPLRADTNDWYRAAPAEVTTRLGVDPAAGLSGQRAAELLAQQRPELAPG